MKRSAMILAAVPAALAMSAPAVADAGGPPSYQECLAEQAANVNTDCVGARQVGDRPRGKGARRAPRTVRVSWSLGACAGQPVVERAWRVRFIRDDRLGTPVPAAAPDGTPRYRFAGTEGAGSRDVRLRPGSYTAELALTRAANAEGGDCGPVDVASAPFVVR